MSERAESKTTAAPETAEITATAWIAEFAERLGVDAPDAATIEQLLDLAGVAAHASERIAAPIACYLVGRAGIDTDAARRAADEVSAPEGAPGP